jgi:hypothetical protein
MGNTSVEEKESNLENYSKFLASHEERDSVEECNELGWCALSNEEKMLRK